MWKTYYTQTEGKEFWHLYKQKTSDSVYRRISDIESVLTLFTKNTRVIIRKKNKKVKPNIKRENALMNCLLKR